MPDYMSKSAIAADLSDAGLGGKQQIANILDGLAELAEEELAAGRDFQVPGIVKIGWAYRPPKAKGERWKAGEEVTGIGGVTSVKETDSPAVKAAVTLKPALRGKVGKLRLKKNEMGRFLNTKVGKSIVARKG